MIAANDALERLKQGNARFAANVRDMSALASKTVDELEQPSSERSPNLAAIVNRIRPSVTTLVDAGLGGDREALVHHATRANVRASVSQLRTGSVILEDLIAHEGLQVVGAEYSLETGVVDFFDADLDGEYQGSVEH